MALRISHRNAHQPALVFLFTSLLYILTISLVSSAASAPHLAAQPTDFSGRIAWLQLLEEHIPDKPITITSVLQIGAAAESSFAGAWLAGFAIDPASAPTALALCWAPAPMGWFGERWGLQIISSNGLLPRDLSPRDGSELLNGSSYITVFDATPVWGHIYETKLSYYPVTGALAVQVTDMTKSEAVYSGTFQVHPVHTSLYPGAGFAQTNGDAPLAHTPYSTLESLSAKVVFNPLQTAWGLIQPQLNGAHLSSVVDRRAATSLSISTPWLDLPGEWLLSAEQNGKRFILLQQRQHEQEAQFPLLPSVIANLPTGRVTLTLEYKDENEVTYHSETPATVGILHASITDLQPNSDGTVAGKLRVESDGPVDRVSVSLNAKLAKALYDRDDRGVLKPSEQLLKTENLLSQELSLSTASVQIPFKLNIADLTHMDGQYINARLTLEPTVSAQDGITVHVTNKTLPVTVGKPRFVFNPSARRQTIDGFGASGAWWAQYLGGMSDPMRNKIADLLFSMDNGIGLSQYRYNIGGGIDTDIQDPWRTAETYEIAQGVYDWGRDANARWFLQAAKERGVQDFILFAVSPPSRITRSGHTYNKNKLDSNLSAEMFPQFAQYLADIWKHFRDAEGITFNTVSPFNEPEWAWEGGNQEGTPFTLQQVLGVSRSVASTFKDQNIPAKLLIPEAGAWEFLYGKGRWYADMIAADPLLAEHSILAFHSYWTTDAQRRLAGQYMTRYPNQRVWQTEWCEMLGGRDYGMGSALTLAHTVHADLTLANVSAWQHWVAVDRYDHRDSLLYTEYFKPGDAENIEETKKLWALGNYSRFVRPGAIRIEVESNYALSGEAYRSAVLVSAFIDEKDGKLVIVAINQSDVEQRAQFVLPTKESQLELVPYRTSETESLQALEPMHLAADSTGKIDGEVVLAPLSITTFVADYQID